MRSIVSFGLLAACVLPMSAQSLGPSTVSSTGGSGSDDSHTLSWSVGQSSSATYIVSDHVATAGVLQPEGVVLHLNMAALLEGSYDANTGLMHDSLRVRGLLPDHEPFTSMGLQTVGVQGGSQLMPDALQVSGPDAVVDWVWVELRDAGDASHVLAARAAVVQRDGDVVDTDGASPVRMTALPGFYRIALLHRNHLPVLTLNALQLNAGSLNGFDLTAGDQPLHTPDAQVLHDGKYMLWRGDVNGDGSVKYTGAGNDRDPILEAIGGSVPTNTTTAYSANDVNLDGTVKYTGANNDRDPVLVTVGGVVPTAVRAQPLP